MMDRTAPSASGDTVAAMLRGDLPRVLARSDAVADSVLPILRHLVIAQDSSLFSEEILVRVRAMAGHLACELLEFLVGEPIVVPPRKGQRARLPAGDIDLLVAALLEREPLLSHLHALALEWQLAERLQSRLALDPVVSPLLQDLLVSFDAGTRALAIEFMAAQSRWSQSQRAMQIAIDDLPSAALESVLETLRALGGPGSPVAARAASLEAIIRAAHASRTVDEGGRIALARRLLEREGGSPSAGLSLTHGGVALFVTALAAGAGMNRDAAALATHASQAVRLALALRASGASSWQVEEQFLALHPGLAVPAGVDGVDTVDALAMLGSSLERPALTGAEA